MTTRALDTKMTAEEVQRMVRPASVQTIARARAAQPIPGGYWVRIEYDLPPEFTLKLAGVETAKDGMVLRLAAEPDRSNARPR